MKLLFRTLLAATLSVSAGMAGAQAYPSRPITIVVPFTPSGATDSIARALALHLSTEWKQPVVVENKPGAGGAIGVQAVARSAPDGYTLLLGSVGPMTINPGLYAKLPYDTMRDFEAIGLLAKTPAILVVPPQSPANNAAEFVAWLKANPGQLNYGSAGTGNVTHLVSEFFMRQAKVTAKHIPYKGSAPAITDLLGGQIDFMFDVVPTAQPYVKSGKFKAIAVTTLSRSPALPQVPTLHELGFKGFDVSSWFGLFAPAGTPPEVIAKLNAEMNKGMRSPAGLEKLQFLGAEPATGTPQEFKTMINQEMTRWKKVISDGEIKAD